MGWEQHRYAIERARDMRKQQAHHAIEANQGVSLQSEAAGGDAELLNDVADFLMSLDGYDGKHGSIGFLDGSEKAEAFIAEWNKTISTISVFCSQYGLAKPDMLFHPEWQAYMSVLAGQRIGAPLIYAGVRVRFGTLASMDVLRT